MTSAPEDRPKPRQTLDLVFWPVGHAALDLRDHLAIARAGGFDSLAIAPNRAKALMKQGLTAANLVDMAAEQGLRYSQLDGIATWVENWRATKGDPALNAWIESLFDIDLVEALEIGEALGATAAVAVPFFDEGSIPHPQVVENFRNFCDTATQYGIEIHIEFIPFWGVPDLPGAAAIVAAADHANSGIMVDTWHLQKGSSDFQRDMELLRTIPAKWLKHVQLADADRTAHAETLAGDVMFRKFPGEGELALAEMLTIIAARGNLASIGPEVVNAGLADMPLAEIGDLAGRTTRNLLAQVGISVF
ncbi:MAG: sugar phosphate isomerase/epimerase [Pseudomonadota bacterium]